MQIFIDSADINEIREAASMGVVDGVTTNPSLVAKTGRRFEEVLADILEVIDGPISADRSGGGAGLRPPRDCRLWRLGAVRLTFAERRAQRGPHAFGLGVADRRRHLAESHAGPASGDLRRARQPSDGPHLHREPRRR